MASPDGPRRRPWIQQLLLVAFCALSFSWTPSRYHAWHVAAAERARSESVGTIVLVTIDGVRWQDLFLGPEQSRVPVSRRSELADLHLPNFERLMQEEGAVFGAPEVDSVFEVSGPSYLSLPGYTQLFSGRANVECENNECEGATTPTLFDVVGQRHGRHQAVVVASWPQIQRAAALEPQNVVASTGRNEGYGRSLLERAGLGSWLSRGKHASPAPGYDDYRPDEHTAALALAVLEHLRPRLLFVGLGDTDEHAHHNDYLAYYRALRDVDTWLGEMTVVATKLRERGHPVTFFITTDHGRGTDFASHGRKPEAGRTWLVVTGDGVAARDAVPGKYSLADVGPTIAARLGVELPHATGTPLLGLLR